MKSSVNRKSFLSRIVLTAAAIGSLALSFGCKGGAEGDRCNPNLISTSSPVYNEDECNTGLTCQTPSAPACPEAYCCPPLASSSSNPNCNGSACPAPAPSPDGGQ
jgi:hypothetical protein